MTAAHTRTFPYCQWQFATLYLSNRSRSWKKNNPPIIPHSMRRLPTHSTHHVWQKGTLYRFSYWNYLLCSLFLNQFQAVCAAFHHFFSFTLFCFLLLRWINSTNPLTQNTVSCSISVPFLNIHIARNTRLENSPFERHMDFIATEHDTNEILSGDPWLVLLCRAVNTQYGRSQYDRLLVSWFMQGIPMFKLNHRQW